MAQLDKTTCLTRDGRMLQFIHMTREEETWLPQKFAGKGEIDNQSITKGEAPDEGKLQSTQDQA